ncbi:putative spermidine/putrescine transport system permease protein [Halalkaliarchaeum desulfuricum]|uniref:Putative spermidine/putrescine transport system permease protein n=1 Tax=Halalkaliarchaeum desulfuricum TaxID=2055893 RepID=A0A343TGP1_9EURY|nr:ABC transporter permease subunit [Halalkaliarchaeum desulfuricum]AUX08263.1 putative spermidine/putrescine transport system permease protein [Halalkaliarchaeum desulfuricum]
MSGSTASADTRNPSGVVAKAQSAAFPETEADRERRRIVIMCLPYFALAAVGAFVPLAIMARMSVSTERFENAGFTMEAWRTLLTEPVYWEVAWNTLWFAVATTVFSVVIGVAISHALAKYDLPFENTLIALISFPIALPGIVVAFMIIVLFGRTGLLTNLVAFFTGQSPIDLAMAVSVFGLFLGYSFSLIPRSTMVLRGAFAEINEDAEEAARSLGASPLLTFYYVTLPQVWPGIVAALVLTFRTALAIFGTVLVLPALNVATLRISLEIQSLGFNSQIAAAIGLIYFFFILSFTFAGVKLLDNEALKI